MKALFLTLSFSLIGMANTQLEVDRLTRLHTYNHKPSIKLKQQRKLRALANIKEKEAIKTAQSMCNLCVDNFSY